MECVIQSLGSDRKIAQRLAQMGVLPGATLHIIRLAPFAATIEVSVDGGQSFAIRKNELAALDCEAVALPLVSRHIKLNSDYHIRYLYGGKKFQQRMASQGIHPGLLLKVINQTGPLIEILLVDQGKTVKLGRGKAEKIIIRKADD